MNWGFKKKRKIRARELSIRSLLRNYTSSLPQEERERERLACQLCRREKERGQICERRLYDVTARYENVFDACMCGAFTLLKLTAF